MKTQIIALDSHDDLISVRDKLAWAKTPRILLVWPPRGRVGLRPLDLKLLQRHAEGLGAQLGLVTRSDEMIQSAREIGLPVFRTASEAQRVRWPAPPKRRFAPRRTVGVNLRLQREQLRPKEPAWLGKPPVRLVLFLLGVLAALTIAALFIPSAQVSLPVPSQRQSVALPVTAGPEVEAVSLSGLAPAETLSLTVEDDYSIPAGGVVVLPQDKARGEVTFRNLTDRPIVVPAGTLVRTLDSPPLRFRTTRSGEVPAGVDGSLDLPVEALAPGRSGNVAAGAIQALEGALGPSLQVSNAKALTGGTDLSLRGPSASDRRRARSLLLASLERQALVTFEEQSAGGLLLPSTLRADVLEETYMPPEDQPGDRLTVHLRVAFSAEFVRRADLQYLGDAVLDAALEPGQAAVPDSLEWEILSPPNTGEDGLTRFRLRLTRRIWQRTSSLAVIQAIQGRTPASAAQRLQEALSLQGHPQIHLWPSWWPWLPLASTRIDVAFEFP